jgi:hypothetical protein
LRAVCAAAAIKVKGIHNMRAILRQLPHPHPPWKMRHANP